MTVFDAGRAAELIAAYGSPMYVYDLDRVREARADLVAAVPEGAQLLYSLKANPHPDLVGELLAGGCHAEVSSTGELSTALAAGAVPAEVFYTGPGKTAEELEIAVRAGVGTFSCESLVDLQRVAAAARECDREVDVVLRVNGAEAPGGAGMRMTGEASQFGTDVEILMGRRAELAGVRGVRLAGFHFFPLTNVYDEQSLLDEMTGSVRTAAALAGELGIEVRVLDLGGGFACPFAKEGERPRYPGLRAPLTAALDEHFPRWRATTRVLFESGRHLVGDSGVLLCTVSDVKDSRGTRFAVLDTGINHLGGLSGIGRLLPLAAAVLPVGSGDAEETASGKIRLVGPLCTPADTLGRGAADVSAHVRVGQILAIPNVGAYGPTASLIGFLGRPGAAEIVVSDGDVVTASRLVLVREPVAPHTTSRQENTMETTPWDARYPKVLAEVLPRLGSSVGPDDNLRAAGLDSLALVDLLVRLEEAYDVTIPDDDLDPEAFATPASLWQVVQAALARTR
ncbi:phosphopantetheine-binding protein [Prauserella sp. PE36]|uniref:phosphopantetheine-binding protein n=1 Tax=Prauserella sp. PE36 TaxID=1504709 RepID=UPI0018F70A0C|nr:phosphopantetheine-binding protein [Prauserella sp. PE36]